MENQLVNVITTNTQERKKRRWNYSEIEILASSSSSSSSPSSPSSSSSSSTDNENGKQNECLERIKSACCRDIECSVCHEIVMQSCVLPCGHIFCNFCIRMWLMRSDTCPICRNYTEFIISMKNFDNFIDKLLLELFPQKLNDRVNELELRTKILQEEEEAWLIKQMDWNEWRVANYTDPLLEQQDPSSSLSMMHQSSVEINEMFTNYVNAFGTIAATIATPPQQPAPQQSIDSLIDVVPQIDMNNNNLSEANNQ